MLKNIFSPSPYWLPVWFFAFSIFFGSLFLYCYSGHPGGAISFVDALFTATSAMCVTGLTVVDTGTFFSLFGQNVILVLIQLGGVGVMTFTTLLIYLSGKRVSLGDRMAVGKSLLHDPTFNLALFIKRIIIGTIIIEIIGAVLLCLIDSNGFSAYSAIFYSISAFCNGGFALHSDSLSGWSGNVGINLVVMTLIILGGLGFTVLHECTRIGGNIVCGRGLMKLSYHSKIVLQTTLFLIFAGAILIFLAESKNCFGSFSERLLTACFQSVTCRTAGFNSVDIGGMSNLSLIIMMVLMLIGGAPGSCAGGMKVTTFRAICGFVVAQFKGHEQVRVGRYAIKQQSMHQALSLFMLMMMLVTTGTLVLTFFAGNGAESDFAREYFLLNIFEVISAVSTTGLSAGATALLGTGSKLMLIVLMFIGRVGPIWLLFAMQSWHVERRYRLPEDDLPMG